MKERPYVLLAEVVDALGDGKEARQVAVGNQAPLWFSGSAGGVDYIGMGITRNMDREIVLRQGADLTYSFIQVDAVLHGKRMGQRTGGGHHAGCA